MPANGKIISGLTFLIGLLMSVGGLASVLFYVFTVIDVIDQPDQSLIFWFSIFLFWGLILLAGGILPMYLGIKSFKGDASAYRIARYFLAAALVILIMIAIMIAFRSEQANEREQMIEIKDQARANIEGKVHRIDVARIISSNESGFQFLAAVEGNLAGTYRFGIVVSDFQAKYMERSEEVFLMPGSHELQRYVSFEDIFKICPQLPEVYPCVQGAGTSSGIFQVEGTIMLIDSEGIDFDPDDSNVASTRTAEFTMDTRATKGWVDVSNFNARPGATSVGTSDEILEIRLDVDAPFSEAKLTISNDGSALYKTKVREEDKVEINYEAGTFTQAQWSSIKTAISGNGFFMMGLRSRSDDVPQDGSTYTMAVTATFMDRPGEAPHVHEVSCYEFNCLDGFLAIKKVITDSFGEEVLEMEV